MGSKTIGRNDSRAGTRMMWLFFACSSPQEEIPIEYMDSVRLLRRISLDVRGELPSMQDIETVRNNPETVYDFMNQYMEEPQFERQVMHWLNEVWHTRVDTFTVVADDFYMDDVGDWYLFTRSVGEEPLRLLAYIATHDKPWTDIVTVDYTITNELLASIYPVDYPQGASGWQISTYTDGRPAVGVLSTNGLWWRYSTDSLNMNRSRAAAITRLLLCDDILARPVSFEASAHALEDTYIAVRTDPACLTCHSSLDPLASSMFGFYWVEEGNPLEAVSYHPEREQAGYELIGAAPSWYGIPVTSFADIGIHIANDSRFRKCGVQTFSQVLLRRSLGLDDFHTINEFQSAFEAADLKIKPLVLSIMSSDEYRIETASEQYPNARTPKMLAPYQIESALYAVSQYVWQDQDGPLLDNKYRIMAGGVDGAMVSSPQLYSNLTSTLVLRRLAQNSATHIAKNYLDVDTELLHHVNSESKPSDPEFVAQLDELRWRLHGREPTVEWRSEIIALWEDAYQIEGSEIAWIAVLSAMFQDFDFVSY